MTGLQQALRGDEKGAKKQNEKKASVERPGKQGRSPVRSGVNMLRPYMGIECG